MRFFWLAPLLPFCLTGQVDRARLEVIPARMQEFVDRHEVSGAVTLVATRKGVVHLAAVGAASPSGHPAMRTDSIFWIASMSKPVTAAAVLMLQDAGKLSIEDPVSKYVPELGELKDAQGRKVVATLRHLLTHTSGMAEASAQENAAARKLADLIPAYASKPVGFEPGSQWRYCQSGINTLARVVEIVSGQPFDAFLQQRLFDPLGMKDTVFYLSEERMSRFVTPAVREGDRLVESTIEMLHGGPASHDRPPLGNAGLFSTAPDYAIFAQMLLHEGKWKGRRYLSAKAVRLMSTYATGDLKAGFTPGCGYGLGVGVVRHPQGVTAMLSRGTFGHGGAYGTQAWIDPQKGVVLVLMIQRVRMPGGDASEIRRVFQETAMGR